MTIDIQPIPSLRSDDALDVALALAEQGIKTIPVTRGEKKPAIAGWQEAASKDWSQLLRWFGQGQSSIGVPTGVANGLVVIDVDAKHDGFARLRQLEAELGALPPTVEVNTGGGGKHAYFRLPTSGELIRNAAGVMGAPGVDVRGEGGFVVAPPSTHDSGASYAWAEGKAFGEVELAELPQSWIDALCRRSSSPRTAGRLDTDGTIPEGARNETLFRRACSLRARGREVEAILEEILQLNADVCQPPLLEDEVRSIVNSATSYPNPEPQTDLGNARRLVRKYGSDLRFNVDSKKWLHWTGRHWKQDDDGHVDRFAKAVAEELLSEAGRIPEGQTKKAATTWAKTSQSRPRLVAAIELAKSEPEIPIQSSALNADAMSLNTQNGVVDLRTGRLRAHAREELHSRITAAAYDAAASCPKFDRFLDTIFAGDRELIAFVQRCFGYAATGDASAQCLFLFHGSGANGKSLLVNTIRQVLGDYAVQSPIDTFLSARPAMTNDIARLAGARLVSASEAEQGANLAASLIKQITGGEPIAARWLYGEFFEFRPAFKLFMSTNHLPRIHGSDEALWRRIHHVPFNVVIPPERRDPRLGEALFAERNGILRWIVEGAVSWSLGGLQVPASVKLATQSYRREMDEVGQFLDERCDLGSAFCEKAGDLYLHYKGWCFHQGSSPVSNNAFGRDLTRRGYGSTKVGGVIVRNGVRLKDGSTGGRIGV
jgi:putative DNA primase/helicase